MDIKIVQVNKKNSSNWHKNSSNENKNSSNKHNNSSNEIVQIKEKVEMNLKYSLN